MISSLSGQPEDEANPEAHVPEEASQLPAEQVLSGQEPSAELPAPGLPAQQDPVPVGTLRQALRSSPGRLDGHPRTYVTYEEEKQWAFIATRQDKRVEKKVKKYVKKNQKTGAGREK